MLQLNFRSDLKPQAFELTNLRLVVHRAADGAGGKAG
jgi:hypothetical protein